MSKLHIPSTQATRFLRERQIPCIPHIYRYQGGGARASAEILGMDPMRVAKTLLFENAAREPLVVVMNGPYETSTKALARELGTKSIEPCEVERAEALTGYRVGGISPFGQRTVMPIYIQIDLFEFETILVNGGQRGFLVELAPTVIEETLGATLVDVALERRG